MQAASEQSTRCLHARFNDTSVPFVASARMMAVASWAPNPVPGTHATRPGNKSGFGRRSR